MSGTVERVEQTLLERWVAGHPHGSAALIQGPPVPTIADIRNAASRLTDRLTLMTGASWVAAGSLVGLRRGAG